MTDPTEVKIMIHYPQAPPMTADEVEALLLSAPIAHLATHSKDGTIHLAPTWFLYEEGHLLIGTQQITRKVHNVAANPRVTVVVDNQEAPFKGVIIYGTAQLEHQNAMARRVPIFAKYMPAEQAEQMATGLAERFEPVIIRIWPEQIISYDYAKM